MLIKDPYSKNAAVPLLLALNESLPTRKAGRAMTRINLYQWFFQGTQLYISLFPPHESAKSPKEIRQLKCKLAFMPHRQRPPPKPLNSENDQYSCYEDRNQQVHYRRQRNLPREAYFQGNQNHGLAGSRNARGRNGPRTNHRGFPIPEQVAHTGGFALRSRTYQREGQCHCKRPPPSLGSSLMKT